MSICQILTLEASRQNYCKSALKGIFLEKGQISARIEKIFVNIVEGGAS